MGNLGRQADVPLPERRGCSSAVTMDDDHSDLRAQIERCRRLASVIVDDDLRHSLEDLAREYEDKLPERGEEFMLRQEDERA